MAPKFIIDINLPDTAAEDQMAACQRLLEEKLEDASATPLTVEPVEGDDNVGVDTRAEELKPEPEVKKLAAAPKMGKQVANLLVLLSRSKEGAEAIQTIKGQPIVFSDPAKFEQAKKAFRAQLQVDPPPPGMKFLAVRFKAEQMLGEVK
jgi:hypothetical protein